jgi:single-strand DNA-binding protein
MNSITIALTTTATATTATTSTGATRTTISAKFGEVPLKLEGWGQKMAEKLAAIKIGTPVLVTGELQIDSFDTPHGFKEQRVRLNASTIDVLPALIPINTLCLVGRAGRDPELRYFESGKAIAEISLAVRRNKELTDWFNLEMWNKTADVCGTYVRKGSLIGVQGQLKFETWSDRNTGVARTKAVIQVDNLNLLSSKSATEQEVNYNQPIVSADVA